MPPVTAARPRPVASPSCGSPQWRSLEELARASEVHGRYGPEFDQPFEPSTDRRTLLQFVAASLALGSLSGCGQATAPLLSEPVGDWRQAAGEPLIYATTLDLDGYGRGALVRTHDGRPVKIEGNPRHPASLGAADPFLQGEIWSLYDPDRSRLPRGDGRERGIDEARALLARLGRELEAVGGEGLRILTGPVTSPSLHSLISSLRRRFPGARWHHYSAVANDHARAGAVRAFGGPVEVVYDFTEADVILTLGGDVLGAGPGHIRYAHDYAARRRRGEAEGRLPRLYSVEPTPSLTGARADRRLPLHPDDIERFARQLAGRLELLDDPGGDGHPNLPDIAADLRQAGPRALVVAGIEQSPFLQAFAHAVNAGLGAQGRTVRYIEPLTIVAGSMASLAALAEDMAAGRVSCLLVIDANPVYAAPADIEFSRLMRRVPTTIHAGPYRDETGAAARWHVPLSHPLEAWGDSRAFDGTASLRQPVSAPLASRIGPAELLSAFMGKKGDGYDIVRAHWQGVMGGDDFEAAWRQALVEGVVPGTAAPERPVRLRSDWSQGWPPPTGRSPAVVFAPDPAVWDGRYANNGWLQELPRPLTKTVWGNAALIAPDTAALLGITSGDLVEIRAPNGAAIVVPAWLLPGQAPDTVTLTLGYGRWEAGRLGSGIGFSANPLRRAAEPWLSRASLAAAGGSRRLVSTQDHHRMDDREPVRLVAPGEGIDDPRLAYPSLYPDYPYEGHAWGMAIDLDACLGCNACVVACQAENNVPVVGPEEVHRGREMHWLRVDRYFAGSPDSPDIYFQPLLCMHCEHAPCEVVCPVNATVHSSEGLNEMVYNRCIGTRTCSNNCPYKVRRFNWYDYAGRHEGGVEVENPAVYVRPRGVMEKCTYCVQRIAAARIAAEMEGRRIGDGEVVTACQQACPTRAIVFGDLNDTTSAVTRRKGSHRHYALLGELNTRPRTTYLARIAAGPTERPPS